MTIYLFFFILSLLPLIEGELLGIGRFLLLASCLPLAIYLYRCKDRVFTSEITGGKMHVKTRSLHAHAVFVIFLFFDSLSMAFSPVFARSFNTLILHFVYFIYFLAAQSLADKDEANFKNLLVISLLFPSLVLCFLSFYLLFFKQIPPFASMNLIFANFGHNHVVDFLIFAFPLCLALYYQEKQRLKKVIFLTLNLIISAGFIFSFSRGGILMAILIVLLFGLFLFRHKRHLVYFGILSLLVLALSLNLAGFYFLGKERVKLLDNFVLAKTFRQVSFESRLEYLRQAIFAFKEKPLFGWGLDNFRYLSKKYQNKPLANSWYVHNHFLQMFVETGILGGLAFSWLIFLILKNIILLRSDCQTKEIDFIRLGLTIGVIASVIHSFFDYDWQFSSVFLLFWVIAGYLTKIKDERLKIKDNSRLSRAGREALVLLGLVVFMAGVLEFGGNLLLISGVKAEEMENYKKAEYLYQQGLKVWPFKLEKYPVIIKFYQDQSQAKKAFKYLDNLIKFESINDKNFKLAGELYESNNQPQKATEYYLKAIDLNPMGSESIYIRLIDIWNKKKEGRLKELFQILQNIEKIKGDKCVLKCLGVENEDKILGILLKLVESDNLNQLSQKEQARVYYWLAVLTTSQKDWDKDIVFLNKAVILENKDEYAQFLNDLILLKKIEKRIKENDFDKAEKLIKPFIQKENNHAFHQKWYLEEAVYWLAKIKLSQNKLKEAGDYLEKAIKINPWDDKPYLGLADIYETQGDEIKTQETLKNCLKNNPFSENCKARTK